MDYTGAQPITTTYTNDIVGLTQVLVAYEGTDQVYNLFGLDLILQDDGSQDLLLLTDGLGSVRVEMVGDTVETVSTYSPYGKLLHREGESGTAYGFTGEQHDGATGLLYLRARYYSPYIYQRFLTPDSIVPDFSNPQNLNLYTYVLNNPVLYTDSSGHCIDRETGQVRMNEHPFGTSGICSVIGFTQQGDPPRYYVRIEEANRIFYDMADERDIPYAYPADGCYERAADMAERISERYILAESHVMKAFIYPSSGEVLAIETEYVYSDSGKDITWRYHVAPVILVITEDSGGIWMVIDPSVMDEPATLLEWREEMGDPGAWFDLQDFDKYWPTTMYPSEGSEVDYETIPEARELGSLFVDQYLNQCRSQGYCR